MPIRNGKDTLLSQNSGTLPQVDTAMADWFLPMVFTRVEKEVVNFVVVETPTNVSFRGVWQPFSARQLEMKPEGERKWKWFQVHAEPTLILEPDEVITYLGTQYRVKSDNSYPEYGYVQYELIEDYTGSGP